MTVKGMIAGAPTSVEARFDEDGRLTPLAFHWHGLRLTVASWGRTWFAGDGTQQRQHFLVMTASRRTFELAFASDVRRWWVIRAGSGEAWV
jgi:hypothetical protein